MNILELAPRKNKSGSMRHSKTPVIYSWHKSKTSGNGLMFRFSESAMSSARYISGDRVDIDISDDMTLITFLVSPKGSYALSGSGSAKSKSKSFQLKYVGIDALFCILPKCDGVEGLDVVEITSGKITCKLPTSKGTK